MHLLDIKLEAPNRSYKRSIYLLYQTDLPQHQLSRPRCTHLCPVSQVLSRESVPPLGIHPAHTVGILECVCEGGECVCVVCVRVWGCVRGGSPAKTSPLRNGRHWSLVSSDNTSTALPLQQ